MTYQAGVHPSRKSGRAKSAHADPEAEPQFPVPSLELPDAREGRTGGRVPSVPCGDPSGQLPEARPCGAPIACDGCRLLNGEDASRLAVLCRGKGDPAAATSPERHCRRTLRRACRTPASRAVCVQGPVSPDPLSHGLGLHRLALRSRVLQGVVQLPEPRGQCVRARPRLPRPSP